MSQEEFRQIYDNPKIFDILDKDNDDGITKAEVRQLLKSVQDKEHEPTNLPPTPQDYNDYNNIGDDNDNNDAPTPDNNKP